MMNPFKDVKWNLDLAEKRKFALSLIIGFPAIATFFSVITRISAHIWRPFFLWLGLIGFGIGVVLWLLPQIARPFYVIWYFMACCIGIVVGNLIFILLFFAVITPVGILRRRIFSEGLEKSFNRSKSTYWQPVEKAVDLKRYYRQF